MRTSRTRWPAYAAAGWLVFFAGAHLYWAVGGTAGLPSGTRATDQPLLFVVDLIAVPLCVLGATVALMTVRPRGPAVPRRVTMVVLWTASALAFLHSVGTISDDLLAAAGLLDLQLTDDADRLVHVVYEPLWMLGAVLCALAALAAMVGQPAVDAMPAPGRADASPTVIRCAGERV